MGGTIWIDCIRKEQSPQGTLKAAPALQWGRVVGDLTYREERADCAGFADATGLASAHPIPPLPCERPTSMSTRLSPSEETSATDMTRREMWLMERVAVLALTLACAWPLAFNLVDPDLWGHVRYGQDWLAGGELPRTATHTFTAENYPWINHENLAELALAACYNTFGVTGMLFAKCMLGMGIVLAMVWVASRHGVHPIVSWTLMVVVTANLEAFFPLRPQLFSFALCAVALVLLDRGFRNWQSERTFDTRLLWGLPIVFAVWANSHGGFIAGLSIVGGYLGGRIIELLLPRKNIAWQQVGQLTLIGIVCLAATLVNLYGWQLHRWLALSLIEPRPEITEWLAPHWGDPTFWPWIAMLAVTALSLLGTKERRDWVEIAILLLVVWQSALHLRHIAFVALVCGFWIPVHFQSTLRRLLPTGEGTLPIISSPSLRRLTFAALLTAIALQSFALVDRLKHFPVSRARFPVDAIQFIADRQLEGKMVVAFNWSQYVLAALAPRVRVGFDGRYDTCYPPEVVDMHFDFLLGEAGGLRNRSPLSGPLDGTRVLEFEQPDLVLIDRHYENPVAIMRTEAAKPNPVWVLLYRDRVAELWGRGTKYADPASSAYIPANWRVQDASPRDGNIPWPAFPLPITNQQQLAGETTTTDINL